MPGRVVEPMRSAYTSLVSSALFPIHEALKGHDTVARRRALEKSQWWKPTDIAQLQSRSLGAFTADIAVHVPYYRRLFAETGLDARRVRDIDDLAKLPFLTKAAIRENVAELRSERAGRLKRYNTGGSSGEPLVFYIGASRSSHDVAAKWRATRWWGVDIGDPEIVVWGSPIELKGQDRLKSLRDRLMRSELLPAFEMSRANLDRFVDTIRSRRPRMIFGYPSALARIVEHAKLREARLDDIGLRVAFVTSERLYDHQRAIITGGLGCGVANGYGGRDAGFIAHECPRGGMHICAEDIVVEIVAPDGRRLPPGQAGEIVVTHLATADFPFVRYRTGDIGTLDERSCDCGRGLPLLKDIQGRTTDFVMAMDGTIMHGLALIYVLRDVEGIEQFKIIQESLEHTRVLLVHKPGFAVANLDRIAQAFKRRLGSSVRISIDSVNSIEPERSGKHRYVVSHAMEQGS